jgi:hypothetical protein
MNLRISIQKINYGVTMRTLGRAMCRDCHMDYIARTPEEIKTGQEWRRHHRKKNRLQRKADKRTRFQRHVDSALEDLADIYEN